MEFEILQKLFVYLFMLLNFHLRRYFGEKVIIFLLSSQL